MVFIPGLSILNHPTKSPAIMLWEDSVRHYKPTIASIASLCVLQRSPPYPQALPRDLPGSPEYHQIATWISLLNNLAKPSPDYSSFTATHVSGGISTPGLSILNRPPQVTCNNALGRPGASLQAHTLHTLQTGQKTLLLSILVIPDSPVY